MSETSIFFVVRTDNTDSEPVVVCEIYRDSGGIGNLVASHVMSIEGAGVRLSDFIAAIGAAKLKRGDKDAGPIFDPPCRHCGSTAHTDDECPDEVLVYAVKVNGEDYHIVAHDTGGLALMQGTHASYGQCRVCGSFGNDGQPVAFTVYTSAVSCDGCSTTYPIRLKRTKEVVF